MARPSSRPSRCFRAASARSPCGASTGAAGAAANSCSRSAPSWKASLTCTRTGPRSEEIPRDQRQLRDLLRARRPGGHRPDAHQRQRLPRDSGQLAFFGGTLMRFLTVTTPSVFFAIATALFISALLLALPLSVTTFLSSVWTWICLKLTSLSLAYSALILVVMIDSLTLSLTLSVVLCFACAKDSAGMLSTAITRIANTLLFMVSPPG